MQINNTAVTTRHARPGVLEKVALEVYFVQNGTLFDPYAISGVGIFALSSNGSPSAVLGSDGLIASNVTPLMWFTNSSTLVSNAIFNASNYTPGTTASGIQKNATGRFSVVLDGTNALSSLFNGSALANSASTVGDYVDVWQVKFTSAGGWNVVVNDFHLFNDNFFTVTQPLLLTVRNTLNPKEIRIGSKVDLKIISDITVANRDIDSALKNVFRSAVIQDPQFKIIKLNTGISQLPAHVTVSSYSNTSALIDITSDNTMILNFDTNQLFTHSELLAGNFGSVTGTYGLQAKFTVLTQTFVSNILYFEIV